MKTLLQFVTADKRVCPLPQKWCQLWEILPNKKNKTKGGWNPPLPLILAAWSPTNDLEKRNLLKEHIQYAAENEAIDKVSAFLYSLSYDDWLYEEDVIPTS